MKEISTKRNARFMGGLLCLPVLYHSALAAGGAARWERAFRPCLENAD